MRLKWKLDSLRSKIVLILTQEWWTGCVERSTASENHFGCTLSNSMVTWVVWNLVWIRLGIVLVLEQDSCTVCTICALSGTLK
jgi:hypothetical protein